MSLPRIATMLLASLLLGQVVSAQPNLPGKTSDSKVEVKESVPLDKLKLPGGTVLIVSDDQKDGSFIPKMMLLSPQKYQEMQEKIAQLEKQLRDEKKQAHSCKLVGKVDGDFVTLKADFAFSTEQPRTTVILGLKGAHLLDEGNLDQQTPILDFGEEGFLVRVEKEGNHQLSLQFRVPIDTKKTGSVERSLDLELPGTAITTMNLELPSVVKEIRWNDKLQKDHSGNRWFISLEQAKKLNVTWREPIPLTGSAALPSVESRLGVRLDDAQVLIEAEIMLEDLRGQTREWKLLLPPQANVEVTRAPTGITYELLPPEGKNLHHILRVAEPNTERWIVHAQVKLPKPTQGTRLSIGPFFVEGAYRQHGTITIQAKPEVLHGQRLVYHRIGEVFQSDLPKSSTTPDLVALFQYWNLTANGKKNGRVPLELEIRHEKGQIMTQTEHAVRFHPGVESWEVELTTKITAQSLFAASDAIELQMPTPRVRGLAMMSGVSFTGYPAYLPTFGLWEMLSNSRGQLGEFQAFAEKGGSLDLTPLDRQGRTRLSWPANLGDKTFTAILTSRSLFPRNQQRFRIELPRPLGTLEREARILVRADDKKDRHELLIGPLGNEEPVPDRHSYQASFEQSPPFLEVSLRPFQPEFAVESNIELILHEHNAQVKQVLQFKTPSQDEKLQLRMPTPIRQFAITGAEVIRLDALKESAWIRLAPTTKEKQEITLTYDLELDPRRGQAELKQAERYLKVPLIWPWATTTKSARLRVWALPGTAVGLADRNAEDFPWKDRGLEVVEGHVDVPTLVAQGSGENLPLRLRLDETRGPALPALICKRGVIRVEIGEDQSQLYTGRYQVYKLQADQVELEFPGPVGECLQSVTLGGHGLNWTRTAWNVARLTLQPDLFPQETVLEIVYKLPATIASDKSFRSMLHPPIFKPEIRIDRLRWEVILPASSVGFVLGKDVTLDYRWGLYHGLLAPKAPLVVEEIEAGEGSRDVSLAFDRMTQSPLRVFFMPWLLWLVLCSGTLLVSAILVLVVPMPRGLFAGIFAILGVCLFGLSIYGPTVLPVLFYGSQPGLLIMFLMVAGQWLLQERYRRQVVFMPGFSRTAKSSLNRASVAKRSRDISTIDAPVPSGVQSANSANQPKPAVTEP